MITMADIGWVAGFLEGEGSFCKQRSSPVISAVQVQLDPLLKLHELFGGAINTFQRKEVIGNTYHRWYIMASKAIGIMFTVYPFMSPKRKKQIEKVIYAWKSAPGRGNYRHAPNSQERNLAISEGMKQSIGRRKAMGTYKNH